MSRSCRRNSGGALPIRCVKADQARRSGWRTLLDEAGRLYIATDRGLGLVHTQDVLEAAQALESGLLPEPEEVVAASLPGRFSYVTSPAAVLQR